jgi:hypothetical protein
LAILTNLLKVLLVMRLTAAVGKGLALSVGVTGSCVNRRDSPVFWAGRMSRLLARCYGLIDTPRSPLAGILL